MTPIVALDCQTDGVHPNRKVYEIAMIRRDDTGQREISFFVDIDLSTADPFGLKVGGFYDRHPYGLVLSGRQNEVREHTASPGEAALEVARWTHGAHIIGAVPNFDTEVLGNLLRANGLTPAWHHRLRCVETLTAGYLRREVGGLRGCAEALGIDVDADAEHTALGDARLALRIWDAVMTP